MKVLLLGSGGLVRFGLEDCSPKMKNCLYPLPAVREQAQWARM